MARAAEQRITDEQIYNFLGGEKPSTVAEIAGRLSMPVALVQMWVSSRNGAGYIARDEQGRYATWCAWPRIGF